VNGASAAERLRALSDFGTPWSIAIAATLRLPDHIAQGASKVAELAGRAGADPDTLRRLMRLLVAIGVFDEPQPGEYANTELSTLLLDGHGWRPWLDLDGAPGIWAESWTRLLEAVRTGSSGRDSAWYHTEVAATGRGAHYDALMESQVQGNAERLAETFDWSTVGHVVDVGGGTGQMLRTLLDAHPHLTGTVFDLPQVAPGDLGERGSFVAGNYFTDPLPVADAYVLSQILHSWGEDERATEILRRCATCRQEDGRILVVEGDAADEPTATAASFDLFMLACTSGRRRSVAELEQLGAAAGLTLLDAQPLNASLLLVFA
jgi:SAM-dependent methyltransferase